MANTLDNIVLQESDLLDSDIRLLIHKKRTDPAFTLTDHVRKKLKENTTTTPPASTSALAMRRSKSGLNFEEEQGETDAIKKLHDLVSFLNVEVIRLKEKDTFSLNGFVALKWGITIEYSKILSF